MLSWYFKESHIQTYLATVHGQVSVFGVQCSVFSVQGRCCQTRVWQHLQVPWPSCFRNGVPTWMGVTQASTEAASHLEAWKYWTPKPEHRNL